MKTFLTYLTFAALLALCYVEKINAEAAKSRAHADAGADSVRSVVLGRAEQRAAMAQWRE